MSRLDLTGNPPGVVSSGLSPWYTSQLQSQPGQTLGPVLINAGLSSPTNHSPFCGEQVVSAVIKLSSLSRLFRYNIKSSISAL